MPFSAVDGAFIVLILIFTIASAAKGFINEAFGKASVILSVVVAVAAGPALSAHVSSTIKNSLASKVLSFLIVFVMVFLAVKIIQTMLSKMFSGEILKGLDRALGMALGAAEGVAVVALALIAMKAQPWFDTKALLGGSAFARLFEPVVKAAIIRIGG